MEFHQNTEFHRHIPRNNSAEMQNSARFRGLIPAGIEKNIHKIPPEF